MKVLILIGILITMAVSVSTSSFELDAGNGQVVGQLYLDHKLNDSVGVFAYGFHSKEWSEWYVGPSWTPGEHVSVSIGAGRETGTNKTRWGGSLWAGKGKLSACYLWEDGGSGWWDKKDLFYQVSPKLTVGLTNRVYTSLETGPGLTARYDLTPKCSVKATLINSMVEGGLVISF